MSKKIQHNYHWLFEHLSAALDKAENDQVYNQHYQFYVQNSTHVQWPIMYLEELVVKYAMVTGLKITALQLRTKIANTRVKAFIAMADGSKAPWAQLMHQVNSFDTSRLTQFRPKAYNPAARRRNGPLPRVQQNKMLPEYQPQIPQLPPRATPLRTNTIENTIREIEQTATALDNKLRALNKITDVSSMSTVHDALNDNELQMAFLLTQYMNQPAMAKI